MHLSTALLSLSTFLPLITAIPTHHMTPPPYHRTLPLASPPQPIGFDYNKLQYYDRFTRTKTNRRAIDRTHPIFRTVQPMGLDWNAYKFRMGPRRRDIDDDDKDALLFPGPIWPWWKPRYPHLKGNQPKRRSIDAILEDDDVKTAIILPYRPKWWFNPNIDTRFPRRDIFEDNDKVAIMSPPASWWCAMYKMKCPKKERRDVVGWGEEDEKLASLFGKFGIKLGKEPNDASGGMKDSMDMAKLDMKASQEMALDRHRTSLQEAANKIMKAAGDAFKNAAA